MRSRTLALAAATLVWGVASPADAELLVTERAVGSIVDVEAGGDMLATTRFATGLSSPMGMCFGPNAELYVAELDSGEVTIFTAGGDLSAAPAFATGLSEPFALVCSATQVLVTERGSGEITNITAGGDFTGAPAFASGLASPSDFLRDGGGTLWVVSGPLGEIYDATDGGDMSMAAAFVSAGDELLGITQASDDRLLVARLLADTVEDWTSGSLVEFSTGAEIVGLGSTPSAIWGASQADDGVYDISEGGDVAVLVPFATNVEISGFTDVLFVAVECGNGLVQAGEECDDGNTMDDEVCSSTCTLPETTDTSSGTETTDGSSSSSSSSSSGDSSSSSSSSSDSSSSDSSSSSESSSSSSSSSSTTDSTTEAATIATEDTGDTLLPTSDDTGTTLDTDTSSTSGSTGSSSDPGPMTVWTSETVSETSGSGTDEPDVFQGEDPPGCGCTTTDRSGAWTIALFGLAFAHRSRRRRRAVRA
jgi:MYXO-CTERM domain-containing protein